MKANKSNTTTNNQPVSNKTNARQARRQHYQKLHNEQPSGLTAIVTYSKKHILHLVLEHNASCEVLKRYPNATRIDTRGTILSRAVHYLPDTAYENCTSFALPDRSNQSNSNTNLRIDISKQNVKVQNEERNGSKEVNEATTGSKQDSNKFSAMKNPSKNDAAYFTAPRDSRIFFNNFEMNPNHPELGVIIYDITYVKQPQIKEGMGIIMLPKQNDANNADDEHSDESPEQSRERQELQFGMIMLGDSTAEPTEASFHPVPLNMQILPPEQRSIVQNNDVAFVRLIVIKNHKEHEGEILPISVSILNKQERREMMEPWMTKHKSFYVAYKRYCDLQLAHIYYNARMEEKENEECKIKGTIAEFRQSETEGGSEAELDAFVRLPALNRFSAGEQVRLTRNPNIDLLVEVVRIEHDVSHSTLVLRLGTNKSLLIHQQKFNIGQTDGWSIEKVTQREPVKTAAKSIRRSLAFFASNPRKPLDRLPQSYLRGGENDLWEVNKPESNVTTELEDGTFCVGEFTPNKEQARLIKHSLRNTGLTFACGSPGTGKSVTLALVAIHKALQSEANELGETIAVLTESNAANDAIAVKIDKLRQSIPGNKIRLLRIYAICRERSVNDPCEGFSLNYIIKHIPDIPEEGEDLYYQARELHDQKTEKQAAFDETFRKWKKALEQMASYEPEESSENLQEDTQIEEQGIVPSETTEKKHVLYMKMNEIRKEIEQLEKQIVEEVMKALRPNIICLTLGNLQDFRLSALRYNHLVIDEIAHAPEIKALMSFMKLVTQDPKDPDGTPPVGTMFAMGDDAQLTPFTTTTGAARELFSSSALSLFTAMNPKWIPFLSIQFRMHPGLARVVSNVFYQGRLTDGVTQEERALEPNTFPFPSTESPGLFDNIIGTEELVGNSYINRQEARVVVIYVLFLMSKTEFSDLEGLVIMSPYESQRRLIMKLLIEEGIRPREDLCCTADGMQGRERDFVIISTVRSQSGGDSTIGFLKDMKRACVMMSRGRRGLVIVGNAEALSTTPHFHAVLKDYEEHNSVISNFYLTLNEATDSAIEYMETEANEDEEMDEDDPLKDPLYK